MRAGGKLIDHGCSHSQVGHHTPQRPCQPLNTATWAAAAMPCGCAALRPVIGQAQRQRNAQRQCTFASLSRACLETPLPLWRSSSPLPLGKPDAQHDTYRATEGAVLVVNAAGVGQQGEACARGAVTGAKHAARADRCRRRRSVGVQARMAPLRHAMVVLLPGVTGPYNGSQGWRKKKN